ncbi:Isochorismatase hydrolase [Fusarium denticulatum]|uniref:Isochorismatase hydrolase n=1 Tax=Fusarium denticulatum TaxID=48507 RepID=A0A8H5X6V0_9HYPO|nr:Isochorismatase hydrolase [Fusarium denticulatum]
MTSDEVKVIGGRNNFWLWKKTTGFDLTHPSTPDSPPIYPRIPLNTRADKATIDPAKTALVVIDMQNYFLSPLLGRPPKSIGLGIVDKLVKEVIPVCRKAGIPVVWLGWGVEDSELDDMPPSIARGYDFPLDENFVKPTYLGSIGAEIGHVRAGDGTDIDAGRVMMRDQWNTEFYHSLKAISEPQDLHINKNRLSGFWGGTGIEEALQNRGIRTLLFSGENTDQCVAGTIRDAYTKGWDCLMLSDACATTSPDFAKKCTEYNCEGGWGFVLSCKDLADGVDAINRGV